MIACASRNAASNAAAWPGFTCKEAASRIMAGSLAFRWLPELHLVALGVHHPAELAVARIVRLLQHVATFFAKRGEECREVLDSVVHHEGRIARREVVAIGGAHRPDGHAAGGIAFCIRPREGGATPILHIDAEVLLVPS